MNLIGHQFSAPLLNPYRGQLYDYVVGGNGVFIQAERDHFKVTMPIAQCEVRGLPPVEPYFVFDFPRAPETIVKDIYARAIRSAADPEPKECLWHLLYSPVYPYDDGWELVEPLQARSYASCKPLEDGPGSSHEKALIEIHSHHFMSAKFSAQDDKDETGFRLYGVIGNFGRNRPVCRMRLGVYGYFAPVAASSVLECEDIWEEA